MAVVTEEERNLSQGEKLELIDKEIRELYEQCLQHKFTSSEILECAKPLLEPVWEYESKRRFKRLAIVSSIVALVVALMWYKPTSDFLHACLRIFIITVIPLEKLSDYYKTECLISNPYYEPWRFTDLSCSNCNNLTEVVRLSDVDPLVYADKYMLRNHPVIVTDALKSWPSYEKFSLSFLSQLYETREELKTNEPCNLVSNYKLKPGQHKKLMKRAAKGKVSDFYAYWDNCNMKVTRVYREYCPRPYFFPRMVEGAPHTWLLIAKNQTTTDYRMYIPDHQLIWFAQIRGETPVKLVPSDCTDTCKELHTTIKEGEILVYTTDIWESFFQPYAEADSESILIGGAGYFDM